jgi:hypothetical protein
MQAPRKLELRAPTRKGWAKRLRGFRAMILPIFVGGAGCRNFPPRAVQWVGGGGLQEIARGSQVPFLPQLTWSVGGQVVSGQMRPS